MNNLQINKVELILSDLINDEAYTHSQSINFLIDKMGELVISMAFVNNQMAIAKRILNQRKATAYKDFIPTGDYWTASLIKDYINSTLDTDQYNYDICERCSRSLVHQIDSMRTAISALKMEFQYNSRPS